MASASEVRAQLSHPIIDCDGHIREFMPGVLPYLRESLGQPRFDSFIAGGSALTNSYRGGETGCELVLARLKLQVDLARAHTLIATAQRASVYTA